MGIVSKTRGKVIIGDTSLKEAKFAGAVLTGTVVTAGTAVNVAHGLGATPAMAWIVQGDAYVVSSDATNVSVNSSHSAHAFKAYALL